MTLRYTLEDADKRMSVAQVSSLDPEKITLEYLFALRNKIDAWREAVDEAILLWPDSAFWPDEEEEDDEGDRIDESMDGDHASALTSAGWGTDEDYGYYGGPWEYED